VLRRDANAERAFRKSLVAVRGILMNALADMGSTPISILAAAPRKIMERAVPARIARKKERIKG